MQELQKTIETIQRICSEKNISVNKALTESEVGKDLIVNMRKGQIPAINKIADLAIYLGVSTDYILGLSEQKQGFIKNEKENNEMGKRFINKELAINALQVCLGGLIDEEFKNGYGLGKFTIIEKAVPEFLKKMDIERSRFDNFVALINGEEIEFEKACPNRIEFRKMMLVENKYTELTEKFYSQLEDEEKLLKEIDSTSAPKTLPNEKNGDSNESNNDDSGEYSPQ